MFPTCKCSLGSNVVSVTVFEIFRVKILAVDLLTLAGLTLGHRSPKADVTYYPRRSTILQNFSTIAQTVYEICVTEVFHFLAPRELTPGPKFTKRGNDLADSEIYYPAKISSPYVHPQTNKQVRQLTRLAYIPTCRSPLPPRL